MVNVKAVITKEQAEAIEFSKRNNVTTRQLLRHNVHGDMLEAYASLQTMHVEDLATALIVGYEVEKTAEEKVSEYYAVLKLREEYAEKSGFSGSQHRQGWQSVEVTLNLLGIKIGGVNA